MNSFRNKSLDQILNNLDHIPFKSYLVLDVLSATSDHLSVKCLLSLEPLPLPTF